MKRPYDADWFFATLIAILVAGFLALSWRVAVLVTVLAGGRP